ncbi:MAG: radical SAM protein [Bacteroidales bacterium]|jgi:radical SAM protein with 4Fe4S-binding SPASM domain|nr:radical SAM protein [Bacteroidales bacterium]
MIFYKIKYLNHHKIINFIKLIFCYFLLKFGIKLRKIPAPYFLSIEPTNICNLNCFACPSGSGDLTRKRGFLDLDLFKKIIDNNKKNLICLILHFQGEPLLNKNLPEMIEYAHKNNIYTMFSTNAQLLNKNLEKIIDSKPDKIIISLDGVTQETYEKYRIGGNIDNVFKALESIKIAKRLRDERAKVYFCFPFSVFPFIELQFLAFNHNLHEIKELKKIKEKYEIDKITIKTAQIYSYEQINLLPRNKKYLRYKISENNFEIKNKLKNSCKRIIFGNVISWDGNVLSCCFDKDATFILGNIKNESLENIRNSEKNINFIKLIFNNRKEIDICKNCME